MCAAEVNLSKAAENHGLTAIEQNGNMLHPSRRKTPLVEDAQAVDPPLEAERLELAADQAIAACGGDAREAVKVLLVALGFTEKQVSEGYVRGVKYGRFNTYSG